MATQIARVTEAMQNHPSLTAAQLAEKTGIPLTNIYALRYKAKKLMQGKKKTAPKSTRVPLLKNVTLTDGASSVELKKLKKQLAESQEEAKKFERWCLDWNARCQALVNEKDTLQAEVLATKTIVQYLENRLVGLLKG